MTYTDMMAVHSRFIALREEGGQLLDAVVDVESSSSFNWLPGKDEIKYNYIQQ